ncbi:alkaline phosphatase D family protein [Hyalangium rubrum]|uniref:Alkaline phosphatase D family protein n=1 Tax=Hyalangium rubrum TaxID=3103134 RepID=A0ABU5H1V3_9BACT|nr:alkaline phosphatase D family protein [Hyalangium sp. s54d21]MDY7226090.1 alkaline phosphatase D family protein [Hyalangium sp. s54d21]
MAFHFDRHCRLLGPFLGHITDTEARIWLHMADLKPGERRTLLVTVHPERHTARAIRRLPLVVSEAECGVGVLTLEGLEPDTLYAYRIWSDMDGLAPVDLNGLEPGDPCFRTLPRGGFDHQLDFLVMSCHNPETAALDGANGFGVWAQLPDVIAANKNVRFALLIGDQIYADDVERKVLREKDAHKRLKLYLGMYRKYWSDVRYRRVLCRLPAYLMWDDHDITDGWGSREDSFTGGNSDTFKPEWTRLFESARTAFRHMQASRNPPPLSSDFQEGFDTCFRVGRAGFVLPDLRSHRNVRKGQLWTESQRSAVARWVEAQREHLDVLFFCSPVVFSHGDPWLERMVHGGWPYVLQLVSWLGSFRYAGVRRTVSTFYKNIGDLRDDLNDSWGSEPNRREADRVLDFLFGLQNPPAGQKPLSVVILAGDIHTPGYSTLYSSDPAHAQRPSIPHVVASPISYQPFSWLGEAVYRRLSRVVNLGERGVYSAQISHHYCQRNVVAASLRNVASDEWHLKVKFYLEGHPEPRILLFDLHRSSGREAIPWPHAPEPSLFG